MSAIRTTRHHGWPAPPRCTLRRPPSEGRRWRRALVAPCRCTLDASRSWPVRRALTVRWISRVCFQTPTRLKAISRYAVAATRACGRLACRATSSDCLLSPLWPPAPTGGVHPLYVVNGDYLPLFNRAQRSGKRSIASNCQSRPRRNVGLARKPTWREVGAISSIPPKADIRQREGHVRLVP